ncbi:tetratricopeptide repeat protein [Acidithiobacillus acidisediminis]|uniref:tetratricopeptide repeat protein n=1 Tax=Acidithiobacillus acidisediminis TaxID=2937799 RepID=UPI00201071D9|nr:hypothetical protein [Acidithiobacillus sp. S30A2]
MTKKDAGPIVEEEGSTPTTAEPVEVVATESPGAAHVAPEQDVVAEQHAQAEPEVSSGTAAPSVGGSGTSAPSVGSGGAGTFPPGGSSYPPLPPRQPKKSVASRVFSWPSLVFLLVVVIIILFIWGITAHEEQAQTVKPKAQAAQKTLNVAPVAAPGMATAQPAPKLTADQHQELMSARSAYWHHDIPAAIKGYQSLISQVPDAAFAYGELGNVYYMNGEREKAAQSFEHAAMLLIQQGQAQRAASLIPVLGALDPALAQKVQVALAHSPEDDGYAENGNG